MLLLFTLLVAKIVIEEICTPNVSAMTNKTVVSQQQPQQQKKKLLYSMEPHQFNFNIKFIIIMNYILKIFS